MDKLTVKVNPGTLEVDPLDRLVQIGGTYSQAKRRFWKDGLVVWARVGGPAVLLHRQGCEMAEQRWGTWTVKRARRGQEAV